MKTQVKDFVIKGFTAKCFKFIVLLYGCHHATMFATEISVGDQKFLITSTNCTNKLFRLDTERPLATAYMYMGGMKMTILEIHTILDRISLVAGAA